MFPLTHAYVANKIFGNPPYALVASTLPDISILKRKNGLRLGDLDHRNIDHWMKWVTDKELSWGINSHKIVDEVSHNGYNWDGPTHAFSLWWGAKFPKINSSSVALHLVPEYLVELYVAKTYPGTSDMLNDAVRHVDTAFIGKEIAQVLNEDEKTAARTVENYLSLVHMTNEFTNKMTFLAQKVDREACLELCINKCKQAFSQSIDF